MDAAKTLNQLRKLATLQRGVSERVAAWEQTHGAMGEQEPTEPGPSPAEPAPGPTFANGSSTSSPQV